MDIFTNEPLTSADLEKKVRRRCSTGQRFICTEVTSYEIHTLVHTYSVLRAQIIKWIETLKVKGNLRITLINLHSFNLFLLFIFQLHIFFFLYHFSSFFIPLCFCVFMP